MSEIRKKFNPDIEKAIIIPRNFINANCDNPLISPLYITDIGYFSNAWHHYIERPSGSSEHILIYCIKGSGYYKFGGIEGVLKENSLLILPKDVPHIYYADPKSPWSLYWAHVSGLNSDYYTEIAGNTKYTLPVSIEKLHILKLLFENIFMCLERGFTKDSLIYSAQSFTHILALFFFLNHENTPVQREDIVRIEQSITFMQEHLELSLTLKELADHINLSPTYFCNLFKKKTGFSPIDYFIRLKMQRACQLLDMTDLKINEIADKLGFHDPLYFSRYFHKFMQQSPSDYRDVKKG